MSRQFKRSQQQVTATTKRQQAVPTFTRQTSQDRYLIKDASGRFLKNQSSLVSTGQSPSRKVGPNEVSRPALLTLLVKCEQSARPICFETIDVILCNKDADKMVQQLTGKPVDDAYRTQKVIELDTYLLSLEDLARHWKLIKVAKYGHRSKNYGDYNRDMVMFPHGQKDAHIFSSQTLLSSCMKPIATTASGKKITKADKEYLQHAASMQVHFLQLTSLIKLGLRSRLEQKSVPTQDSCEEGQESIFNSVYNWFVSKVDDQPETDSADQSEAVLTDIQFLQALQKELKLFEVCLRIFEQECCHTIIQTQQEVQSQNIDAIVKKERLSVEKAAHKQAKFSQAQRYLPNQLLDKEGQLLKEQRPQRLRAQNQGGSIKIVQNTASMNTVPSPVESTRQTPIGVGLGNRSARNQQQQRIDSSTHSQTSSQRTAVIQSNIQSGNQSKQKALLSRTNPKQLFVKNTLSSSSASNRALGVQPQGSHMRASTNFTSQVSANKGRSTTMMLGSQQSSEHIHGPLSSSRQTKNQEHLNKAASPLVDNQRFSSFDSNHYNNNMNGQVLSAGRLGGGHKVPALNQSGVLSSNELIQNQFYNSQRLASPFMHNKLVPASRVQLQSDNGVPLIHTASDALIGNSQNGVKKGGANSNREDQRQPNAEFIKQSNRYNNNNSGMASPTDIQSRLGSRQGSSTPTNLLLGSGSQQLIDGKALASQFAYGQALTRKQNEFERATVTSQIFNVDGRKMSSESLGLSGKILSTSPRASDLDENEPMSQGITKMPIMPLLNRSNNVVETSSHKNLNVLIRNNSQKNLPSSTATAVPQQTNGNRRKEEEQENYHQQAAALVLTPPGRRDAAVNMLSLLKTKEIQNRKNRIMENRDQLQKQVEMLHRAQQNLMR